MALNFNHISKKLTETQVSELKGLYKNYHREYFIYKKMFKSNKRNNTILMLSSAFLTATGLVVGSVTLNPLFTACISGSGVILQTVITHKNLNKRTEACRHAYQEYLKTLAKLKYSLRSGEVDEFLTRELALVDERVADACPPRSERFQKLYKKKFG